MTLALVLFALAVVAVIAGGVRWVCWYTDTPHIPDPLIPLTLPRLPARVFDWRPIERLIDEHHAGQLFRPRLPLERWERDSWVSSVEESRQLAALLAGGAR
jgi:hypothetical protein